MTPLFQKFIPLLALFLIGPCPQLQANESEIAPAPASIYPTPQQCELEAVYTQVSNITYTKLQSGESIAKGEVEEGIITLPEVEGAYAIIIKKGELQVYSYDAAGRHYAKQSIIQLLHNPQLSNTLTAQQDPYPENFDEGIARLGKLPLGVIVDWPDLPYRGVVEGFYGRPWSHDDRKNLITFYGRNKLNTYIWAPKDDPYHHGLDCRKPYPEDIAKQITELCELAVKNHVKFVWAIHPADTIDWEKEGGEPDLKALLTKLELMYDLGVRHFACFVDDSSGKISKASRQAELCNYIDEHFIKQHDDLDSLIMCPTGYCKIWTPAEWLTELGQNLRPDIKAMWTGDSVISNITKAGQEWVQQALGRPSFIWWNWPCNDYKRSQLAMGRTYGLDQDPAMKQLLSGLVANPMEWAEASKVGLFGVADYTWNITGFQSEQSWKAGIERLYPSAAEALTRFCQHNADMGRASDGYEREESTHIQQAAAALRQTLGKAPLPPEPTQQIHQEFVAICNSGIELKQAPELANLRQEISPWFQLYTRMGRIGKHALRLLQPQLAGDSPSKLSDLLQAWISKEDSLNSELRPKVGTIVLAPLVDDCAQAAAKHIYHQLSGQEAKAQQNSIGFSHSQSSDNAGSERIFDQNPNTFWSSTAHQAVGAWVQFDLGSVQTIGLIKLSMGGERPNDYPEQGQWSSSLDGQNWQDIGPSCTGDRILISTGNTPIEARYLRYTITEAKAGNLLSLCEFSIEDETPDHAQSTVKEWAQLSVQHTDKQVGISPQLEYTTIKSKDCISLSLNKAVKAKGILIDLGKSKIYSKMSLNLVLADGSTQEQELPSPKEGESSISIAADQLPAQNISAMVLTYTGEGSTEIKLTSFAILCDAGLTRSDKKALFDGDILSAWDASNMSEVPITIPEGCRQLCIISTNLNELQVDGAQLIQGDDSTIRHISLPEDCKSITLQSPAPQQNALIHEIIFIQ